MNIIKIRGKFLFPIFTMNKYIYVFEQMGRLIFEKVYIQII